MVQYKIILDKAARPERNSIMTITKRNKEVIFQVKDGMKEPIETTFDNIDDIYNEEEDGICYGYVQVFKLVKTMGEECINNFNKKWDKEIKDFIMENPRTFRDKKLKEETDDKDIKSFKKKFEEMNENSELLDVRPSLERVKELLNDSYSDIIEVMKKYMDMPEEYFNIIALWVIGTYLHDKFETYPYLFFNAMKGSGKSRIVDLITHLSKDGIFTKSLTEAVLFRTTGTLGIDEFEKVSSKEKSGVREILNSAYKKGAKVMRMRKTKTKDGETQTVETFDSYRPVVMANIFGMEEVLGDRCITLILERSNNKRLIMTIQHYTQDTLIKNVNLRLKRASLVKVVYVVYVVYMFPDTKKSKKGEDLLILWNEYVQRRCRYIYPTLYTNYTNYTNYTTQYTKLGKSIALGVYSVYRQIPKNTNINENRYNKDNIIPKNDKNSVDVTEFFEKVYDSGITGRNLELFFPLLYIAYMIDKKIFYKTLKTAQKIVKSKIKDDETNSSDIMLLDFISKLNYGFDYISVKKLLNDFKVSVDEEHEWLNVIWLGRALKRLSLIIDKKRIGSGIQIILNVPKAKEKIKMFQDKNNPK